MFLCCCWQYIQSVVFGVVPVLVYRTSHQTFTQEALQTGIEPTGNTIPGTITVYRATNHIRTCYKVTVITQTI